MNEYIELTPEFVKKHLDELKNLGSVFSFTDNKNNWIVHQYLSDVKLGIISRFCNVTTKWKHCRIKRTDLPEHLKEELMHEEINAVCQKDSDTPTIPKAEFIPPEKAVELIECLQEAIDLMESVRNGEYSPDTFTTQPWKRIISELIPHPEPLTAKKLRDEKADYVMYVQDDVDYKCKITSMDFEIDSVGTETHKYVPCKIITAYRTTCGEWVKVKGE
jgi:hypothetical protein